MPPTLAQAQTPQESGRASAGVAQDFGTRLASKTHDNVRQQLIARTGERIKRMMEAKGGCANGCGGCGTCSKLLAEADDNGLRDMFLAYGGTTSEIQQIQLSAEKIAGSEIALEKQELVASIAEKIRSGTVLSRSDRAFLAAEAFGCGGACSGCGACSAFLDQIPDRELAKQVIINIDSDAGSLNAVALTNDSIKTGGQLAVEQYVASQPAQNPAADFTQSQFAREPESIAINQAAGFQPAQYLLWQNDFVLPPSFAPLDRKSKWRSINAADETDYGRKSQETAASRSDAPPRFGAAGESIEPEETMVMKLLMNPVLMRLFGKMYGFPGEEERQDAGNSNAAQKTRRADSHGDWRANRKPPGREGQPEGNTGKNQDKKCLSGTARAAEPLKRGEGGERKKAAKKEAEARWALEKEPAKLPAAGEAARKRAPIPGEAEKVLSWLEKKPKRIKQRAPEKDRPGLDDPAKTLGLQPKGARARGADRKAQQAIGAVIGKSQKRKRPAKEGVEKPGAEKPAAGRDLQLERFFVREGVSKKSARLFFSQGVGKSGAQLAKVLKKMDSRSKRVMLKLIARKSARAKLLLLLLGVFSSKKLKRKGLGGIFSLLKRLLRA